MSDPALYAGSFVFHVEGHDEHTVVTCFIDDQFTLDPSIQHAGGVHFLEGVDTAATVYDVAQRICANG